MTKTPHEVTCDLPDQASRPDAPSQDQVAGCLLGHSLADALGNLFLGLPRSQAAPAAEKYLRPWLAGKQLDQLPNQLLITDGAQLSWELVLDFLKNQDFRPERFAGRIRQQLAAGFINRRYWETHAAAKNLRAGQPWYEAGVPSTGSGSVHRSVALGVLFWSDPEKLRIASEQQSWVTHKGRLTSAASAVVAQLVASVLCGEAGPTGNLPLAVPADDGGLGQSLTTLPSLVPLAPENALKLILAGSAGGAEAGLPDHVRQTLLWALYCVVTTNWDYRQALPLAVQCGGDLIAPLALVGALCGAAQGTRELPTPLLERLTNRGFHMLADLQNFCDQICRIGNHSAL